MREKRKKKMMYLIMIQLIAIYTGLVFWTLNFQSQTSAAYNDVEHLTFYIAADWPIKDKNKKNKKNKGKHDKSSIYFIQQTTDCQNRLLTAAIQNAHHSNPMKNQAVYEVYWSDNGKPIPKYGGQKIHSGTVPKLRSGETFTLAVKVEKAGQYAFKISHSGHEIWSKTFQVDEKCFDKLKGLKIKQQASNQADPQASNQADQPLTPENSTLETEDELQEPAATKEEVHLGGDDEMNENDAALD